MYIEAVQAVGAAHSSSRFVFGLDANAYERGDPGETLDVTEFATEYTRLDLASCWGPKPNPQVHTTRNARTYMQPQLSKAAAKNEVEAKGDANPKDFILFWSKQYTSERPVRDNTGEKRYIEDMVFPTLTFPSDHAVLSAALNES